MYVCVGIHVCMHYVSICVCVHMCLHNHRVCLVARYSFSNSFVRPEFGNRRFKVVLIRDSIHRRFEDRPMDNPEIHTGSCSEDQTTIRFQNCVISCECLLLYLFLISRCLYYSYVTYIISFDRLILLTSMITCTISYNIRDRTTYIFS